MKTQRLIKSKVSSFAKKDKKEQKEKKSKKGKQPAPPRSAGDPVRNEETWVISVHKKGSIMMKNPGIPALIIIFFVIVVVALLAFILLTRYCPAAAKVPDITVKLKSHLK